VAGSTIANNPNKMNNTAANIYQPVNRLAFSITGLSVAMSQLPRIDQKIAAFIATV
jgi:hypothetical protein